MHQTDDPIDGSVRHAQLLETLERLLAIEAIDVTSSLNQASQLVAEVLGADKVDSFIYEPATDSLVSRGASDTPMARLQFAIGMDRQPVANGGRAAWVFQTGQSWHTGRADQDPEELLAIKQRMGIRSQILVPLEVNGERRGVLGINAAEPNRFTPDLVPFVQAVARWTGIVFQRADLVERITHEAAERARRLAADELVTIVAHDLRTPLTPLRGRLEMLLRRAQRDGAAADLTDLTAMSRALARLERMIGDLLDAARLEQGIFALTAEVVDLAALVRETTETLQAPGVEIEVRGPQELPLEADPRRVRQALENLLSNARTHAPDGAPIVVEVQTERGADGERAVVSVRDTGLGIPPELMPNLFTRFTAARRSKGLGLGLYLARGIAEAHGGTLTAESAPGAGATFRLALPIQDGQM